MKKVYVCGLGNMGRRYSLILNMLGVQGVVTKDELPFHLQAQWISKRKDIDGIIIATPTSTHVDAILSFGSKTGLPILCEKPFVRGTFSKSLLEATANIRMVNQYEYLQRINAEGLTRYNYFKTGGDGLFWDCINIIGMANGAVEIDNNSPVWLCTINGFECFLSDMDQAYIDMIDEWTLNPRPNLDYAYYAHEKTARYKRLYDANGMKKFTPSLTQVTDG
jgi:hypothetical protein